MPELSLDTHPAVMPARSRIACLALVSAFGLAQPSAAFTDVLNALATERSWIGYTPRNFNPNIGFEPTEAQMRADLQQLYDAGWRHLYNYTLDGNLQHIPRLAKEVGFEQVLAGVFFFNEAQLEREKTNSVAQDQYIDGYIVGNEGLFFGRYNGEQLLDALNFFAGYNKPITTTEVGGAYLAVPDLIDVGTFAYVNIQPWFNGGLDPFDPAGMAQAVRDELVAIQTLRPDRLVIIKEAWWPTGAHPAATEANQVAFYEALSNLTDANGDPILFAWGESHDQPWKNEPGPFATLGPDWGLYETNGDPKLIVDDLQDVYTGAVPVNFEIGDYNRDGVVNGLDHDVWETDFGSFIGVPGRGADGNFDAVIDAADYTVWRDAVAAAATSIPEPTAASLAALSLAAAGVACRTRT